MMSEPSSHGLSTNVSETKADPKLSVFSRVFNRNGHNRTPELETKPTGPPKSVWREYFESAVVTVIMALFGMTFVVQAVKVPTGSMQNTITIGDHLLVNKFIFAPGDSLPFLPQREIRRGDIIVFKYPGNRYDPHRDDRPDNKPIVTNYVKRVIGLPGDHIRMERRNVIVNGKALPEHQLEAIDNNDKAPLDIKTTTPREPGEAYEVYYNPDFVEEDYPIFRKDHEGDGREVVIPAGKYFVMGDNRNNSEDSRYWGFVPRELVIGRAMFVYWSYDESAPSQDNFLLDFFLNTRWARTGTMVK
ncbi:MAG TPA: signal peptidase I [Pyrinomonadaceae bacterium]|nr:signal peptidase I [Pyrinomonadaceae bacterium]